MRKTDFDAVPETRTNVSPLTLNQMRDWFRNIKSSKDPMPADVMWRLLVIMRNIDYRLSVIERGIIDAYEERKPR